MLQKTFSRDNVRRMPANRPAEKQNRAYALNWSCPFGKSARLRIADLQTELYRVSGFWSDLEERVGAGGDPSFGTGSTRLAYSLGDIPRLVGTMSLCLCLMRSIAGMVAFTRPFTISWWRRARSCRLRSILLNNILSCLRSTSSATTSGAGIHIYQRPGFAEIL
jgi:hypothetical protein